MLLYLIILYLAIPVLYTFLHDSAGRRARHVKTLFKESISLRVPNTAQLTPTLNAV